jgi:hypothetical protein
MHQEGIDSRARRRALLKPNKETEAAVPEQDEDDEDELVALVREIAREVEDAFATVTYPGDDKLVAYPNSYECRNVEESFRGKHWRDISLRVLREHNFSQVLFSLEAFRFYLPCYLLAALLHPKETDTPWAVFDSLLLPEEEGPKMDRFLARVCPLNARQKAVVRRFVELYIQLESDPDPKWDRSLSFWRRITDPGSAPDA